MILRAHTVITMDGPPIDNGAVAISADRILEVGAFSEIKTRHSGEIVDLGERALLPGLINAHCHLDYTCLRGKLPPPKSFTDWVRGINAERAKLSDTDYLDSIRAGFAEAKRFGTTAIANLTGVPQLVSQVEAPIRACWFAELIDVRQPEAANEILDLALEALKSSEHRGLAPHALYTASANLYRRCEEIARRENILLTTHLAESQEEMSMFRDANGPLYQFLKGIGREVIDCGAKTPLAHFLTIRDSSTALRFARNDSNWILVHLNGLDEDDFGLLARSTINFSIAHCPRSHEYFRHVPFQFDRLRELGLNICLGTDSLASSQDLSLFAEMRQFSKMFSGVSPGEILRMVTVNPARALRQENELGKIGCASKADFIAVPFSRGDVFEEIVAFEGEPWMMLHGTR